MLRKLLQEQRRGKSRIGELKAMAIKSMWFPRYCQGIEGIRAKLTKRGLVLRLGLVIWKAVGLRYAAGIYCREYNTSDRDIRGYSYD